MLRPLRAVAERFTASTRRQILRSALAGIAASVSGAWPASDAAAQTVVSELLVRGTADLPAADIAWRLVQDVAERAGEARFEERALGFVICRESPIQVTEEGTGSAFRLEAHSAAFVADGVVQMRESLTDNAAGYLRLALVLAAEARESGGDRLLFAGPAFAAPAGPRAVTLLRLSLQQGDSAALAGALGDVFILVEQGSVVVMAGADQRALTTVVGSDTAYGIGVFNEPLTIAGARDATLVIVAEIGAAR